MVTARIIAEPHLRTRNTMILLVLLCGLLMSGSLSLAVSLPICLAIAAAIVFRQRHRVVLTTVGGLCVLCVVSIVVLFWPTAGNVFSVVMERLALGLDDPSIAVRYGAKQASVRVFLLHPLVGNGVSPPEADFISQLPPEALRYEQKGGTDSLALQILSGHGAIGFLCFAGLIAIAVKRGEERPMFCIVLFTSIVTSSLQVGYESLYHIWILLGLCNARLSATRNRDKVPIGSRKRTVPLPSTPNAVRVG